MAKRELHPLKGVSAEIEKTLVLFSHAERILLHQKPLPVSPGDRRFDPNGQTSTKKKGPVPRDRHQALLNCDRDFLFR
jgi:hypothetical protein